MNPVALFFVLGVPIITIGVTVILVLLLKRKFRCPHCGSWRYKRKPVETQEGDNPFDVMFPWPGFICRKCQAEYTVKRPAFMKGMPILVGVIIFGIAFFIQASPDWRLTIFGYSLFVIGPAIVIYGIVRLFKKK